MSREYFLAYSYSGAPEANIAWWSLCQFEVVRTMVAKTASCEKMANVRPRASALAGPAAASMWLAGDPTPLRWASAILKQQLKKTRLAEVFDTHAGKLILGELQYRNGETRGGQAGLHREPRTQRRSVNGPWPSNPTAKRSCVCDDVVGRLDQTP